MLYLSDSGGDFCVAGLADEPDGEVTQGGHNAWAGAGPDPGRILTERDITDPVDLVFDRPLTPDVARQVDRGGLAGIQAGDDEYRDRGLHLFPHPALAFPYPHRAGHVPLDQRDLAGVGEPLRDVRGRGHDLDGAPLAPPVAFLLRGVLHRDGCPVQGVELLP